VKRREGRRSGSVTRNVSAENKSGKRIGDEERKNSAVEMKIGEILWQ
jgi:hypothetical protein